MMILEQFQTTFSEFLAIRPIIWPNLTRFWAVTSLGRRDFDHLSYSNPLASLYNALGLPRWNFQTTMSYDTSICLFGHFSRFFNLIYEVGAKIGHFGHNDRTHLGSIIPFRQVEVCIHQKKPSDLMFKDGDTIPPPHTGLFRDCQNPEKTAVFTDKSG